MSADLVVVHVLVDGRPQPPRWVRVLGLGVQLAALAAVVLGGGRR